MAGEAHFGRHLQQYLCDPEIPQADFAEAQFFSEFVAVANGIDGSNELQFPFGEGLADLGVLHPNNLVVVDMQVVWEAEPVVDGRELVVLLEFLALAGLHIVAGLLHQDILLVAVAVQDPQVQNRNFVNLLNGKHIAAEVADHVVMGNEHLQRAMLGTVVRDLVVGLAFDGPRLEFTLLERWVIELHVGRGRHPVVVVV
jgi:hypothetical protein